MANRDKLIQILKNQSCPSPMLCSPECKYVDSDDCHAERLADLLISNDVDVVIRCKDCKRYSGNKNYNSVFGLCVLTSREVLANDFCSDGERNCVSDFVSYGDCEGMMMNES